MFNSFEVTKITSIKLKMLKVLCNNHFSAGTDYFSS